MALEKFKAPALPVAPSAYDQRHLEQVLNALRLYFNRLDSLTPNQANSYRADEFIGGEFIGDFTGGTATAAQFTGGNFNGDYATFVSLIAPIIYGSLIGGNVQANNITGSKVNSSMFTGLGAEITLPHIGASDTTDQYATADNTPTIVKWNTLDAGFGFTLASNAATATYDGTYRIDYSLQFVNTDNSAHDVVVWLRVNGNDVERSATKFTIPARKNVGDPSYLVTCSMVPFIVSVNDDIELYWATDKAYSTTGPVDGVYMEYLPAQTVPYAHPSVPSAIGTILYMSAPQPPLIRVTPIGVSGVGKVGAVTIVTRR